MADARIPERSAVMFSMPDLLVIMGVVLIIFGPGKLPQIGSALGKSIKGFKKATEEDLDEHLQDADAQPIPLEKIEHKTPMEATARTAETVHSEPPKS